MATGRPDLSFPRRAKWSESLRKCLDDARKNIPPCKRSATGICDLIDHVTACNKELWCLGLQVRDDPRDEHGQASVVVIRSLRRLFLRTFLKSDPGLAALAVLLSVLVEHRCIVAVQMLDTVARHPAVLCSLRQIGTLKRLTILLDPNELLDGADGLITCLQSLVVTEGLQVQFINGTYSPNHERSLLHNILRREECRLTALDLTGLLVTSERAKILVDALLKNNSVTELAVGSRIFALESENRTEHFIHYLTKNSTLRKLLLDASDMKQENTQEIARTLVGAICEMTTLEELTVHWLCKRVDIGLFGFVVASNKSLRSLEMRCRRCCDCRAHQSTKRPVELSVMKPWVTGLTTNCSLERLTLDLSFYTPDECSLFIDAISVNVSLKSVTVRNIADNGCLQAAYATIRDRKMQHRVVIEDHHVDLKDVKELPLYTEVRAVTLSAWHFSKPSILCLAIRELAGSSHVTSLRLRFHSYDEALYTTAADYIAAVSTVNDIELFLYDPCEETNAIGIAHVNRLIGAIASNQNLHKVKVHVGHLNAECCNLIAVSFLRNRMLYELSLEGLDKQSCTSFLSSLLPGLDDNYSLLVVRLPDFYGGMDAEMAKLHDITRRNTRLVDLACRFVTRDNRDFSTKSALSLVSEHPKLVEIVAHKAGVTKIEAVSMIKHSMPLPSFRDTERWMSAVLSYASGGS